MIVEDMPLIHKKRIHLEQVFFVEGTTPHFKAAGGTDSSHLIKIAPLSEK